MATLAEASSGRVPAYDRSIWPSIVHLGVGAFARAHLGVFADDLLHAGWPAMVRGVSLRSPTAEEQLGPQDGLYSVLEREPGADVPLRIVGSLASVATGAEAAVDAIASPQTSLVTLTVTEKGYEPGAPAAAVIAAGLVRRPEGAPPPVIASLDNVAGNGELLRVRVLEVTEGLDPARGRWIATEVPFPSSVVDRMVPATTAADLDRVAEQLGVRDLAAVVAERHRSWVIGATDRLPPLADVGVEVVPDVAPYERRKLWLLNGPHSALAYGGLVAGCTTIAEAVAHGGVRAFVRLLVDEVLEVADLPPSTEPRRFAEEALRRFANPDLGHTCAQVGTDGSQKLRQRLLPVVARRHELGLGTDRFAVVAAIWLGAVAGVPMHGVPLPRLPDPAEGGDVDTLVDALGADRGFSAQVIDALGRLVREGPAVLEEVA
jgi:fructuronate reductase